jgi:hypothetical protein
MGSEQNTFVVVAGGTSEGGRSTVPFDEQRLLMRVLLYSQKQLLLRAQVRGEEVPGVDKGDASASTVAGAFTASSVATLLAAVSVWFFLPRPQTRSVALATDHAGRDQPARPNDMPALMPQADAAATPPRHIDADNDAGAVEIADAPLPSAPSSVTSRAEPSTDFEEVELAE